MLAMWVKVRVKPEERERFLKDEWPRLRETIERLGLSPDELFVAPARRAAKKKET